MNYNTHQVELLTNRGLTDAHQAGRFVRANQDRLRYDHLRRVWFVYEPPLWVPDPDGRVYREAIRAATLLQGEGEAIADTEVSKEVVAFAKSCLSQGGLSRVLKVAQHLPPIANVGGLWDPKPLLVGTPNGVLDLETGRLRRGHPDDMLTLSTGVPL